jgi:ABC-2 type transport system permease protein
MNGLRLLRHQIKYEQLSFWRNPQSAFFTFVFPVLVFVIFGAVFGNKADHSMGGISPLQYYSATIAALSVMGACYSQLAVTLAFRRQSGVLKRLRATPLPAETYFGGLVAHCIVLCAIEVGIIIAMGTIYGVKSPQRWADIVITVIVGAAAFCSLGVGVSSLIKNAEAAPAVVQFVFFPVLFLSGTYFHVSSAGLNHAADILPVRPFNTLLLNAFAYDKGLNGQALITLILWGLLGGFVAVRRFRWDPRPE